MYDNDYLQTDMTQLQAVAPSQTLKDFVCSREASYISDLDADIAVCVGQGISFLVHFPVSVLGILANIVVMWAWSSEIGYHPSTYLFKAQALVDTISMTTYLIKQSIKGTFVSDILFFSLANATGKMGVQITMVLAAVRVIKVFFPFRSEKLLSRFRIKLVLAGIAVLNFSFVYLANYLRIVESRYYLPVSQYLGSAFSILIPAMIQLIFMAVVTWKVWRTFRIEPSPTQCAVPFQQEKQKTRRLVYTVLSMCVLTFIADFFGRCFILFIESRSIRINRPLQPYRLAIYASLGIFGTLNTSVNIVFYYLFITKFKILLHKRLREIQQKSRSFLPSSGLSTLPEGQTVTVSTDRQKPFMRKKLSEDVTESKLPACSFERTPSEPEIQSSVAPKQSSSYDTYIT